MAKDFNPADEKKENQKPAKDEQPPAGDAPKIDPPAQNEPEKTKEELEAENKLLRAENKQLADDVTALLQKAPVKAPIRPGHKEVFIKSENVAAIRKNGKKYAEGSVNGVKFEVLCDTQVEVTDAIAEALSGVIHNQA